MAIILVYININRNFSVSVPPHQLLLYDNSGRDVTGAVGPMEEGTDLVLSCEVRGGECILYYINIY